MRCRRTRGIDIIVRKYPKKNLEEENISGILKEDFEKLHSRVVKPKKRLATVEKKGTLILQNASSST